MMTLQDWSPAIEIIGVVLAILTAQWRLSNWLTKQFDSIKALVFSIESKVLDKLEYHERHDDQRFSELHDRLWQLSLPKTFKNKEEN